jgi:hypothetical protein
MILGTMIDRKLSPCRPAKADERDRQLGRIRDWSIRDRSALVEVTSSRIEQVRVFLMFGRVNAGIIPAGTRQGIMIGSRVGDVAGVWIARRDEAVEIRSGRAAEQLMGSAGIRSWLGKIMVFQIDVKDGANSVTEPARNNISNNDNTRLQNTRESLLGP